MSDETEGMGNGCPGDRSVPKACATAIALRHGAAATVRSERAPLRLASGVVWVCRHGPDHGLGVSVE